MRKLPVLIAVAVCAMFSTMPWHASASSIYFTYYPSAFEAYYINDLGNYGALPGIEVRGDSDFFYMSATEESTWWVVTGNYNTVEEWYSPYPSLDYVVGTLPPDDATVISVFLAAYFMAASPALYLRYSIDGETSWNSTPLIPVGYGPVLYNVTSFEPVWTPQMLNDSSNFRVNATCTVVPGTTHTLDYLGFICMWLDDEDEGYNPGEDPEAPPIEEGELTPDFWMTSNGILAILGTVGLIGMIAVPALGVYVYRNGGEDRMTVLVKMLALFMICFTFVLIAISG